MTEHKNYDASFCGKLPIHQTNSIQPHGVLLLIDISFEKILQASENTSELLNKTVQEVVGSPVSSFISQKSIEELKKASADGLNDKIPLMLNFVVDNIEQPAFCLIHALPEGYTIEAELKRFYNTSPQSFAGTYLRIKQWMQQLNQCNTVLEACDMSAAELKKWTGFDKVMIYHFDENWNGTVLSEQAEEGMESYLGFTFPASDIPKPARDMYTKNPYRLIPNREYVPVRLYPVLNPHTNAFTSLLSADLRSVASVHIEYLKNMNVMASMSARIVHNGLLWGLIACHHREPKYLSFEECSVVEMISNLLSQKITSLEHAEGVGMREQLTNKFAELVEKIVNKNNMLEAFSENAGLLKDLLNANGVALSWNGKIEMEGTTPEEGDIETLVYWLREKARNKAFHQPQLPRVFEESVAYAASASGILALPIQPDKGNYLIAFRPELVKTISWGGNPDEAIRFEPHSTAYHPRHSFKVWQETVYKTSRKWHPEEINAAEQFRNFLIDHTLNRLN